MLDQSFDAIFAKTLTGHITSWNKAAETLYGFAAADAIGRQSHDLLNTPAAGSTFSAIPPRAMTAALVEEVEHLLPSGALSPGTA